MHRITLWSTAILFFCFTLLPTSADARPTSGPPPHEKLDHYEKTGPHAIRILEFEHIKDIKRKDRPVEMKVIFPKEAGTFPLVILSHSAGGTWDSHHFQSEHLASHGYVVICVEHVDSNNASMKFYMSKAGGGMTFREAMQHVTTDSIAVLERPRDISFAIDTAVSLNKSNKELAGKINTKKIAVMGHSFGAYTTLAVIGAQPILDHLKPRVGSGKGLAGDLSDHRVTFGLAMSPQGPGSNYFGKESFSSINKPLICLTGSKDDQKGIDSHLMPAESRREMFSLLPPGNKFFLWMANADHVSFTDNHSMWLIPSASRPDVQRISKALMVISCDHFLKGKQEARKSMKGKYIRTLRGEVVTDLEWLEK